MNSFLLRTFAVPGTSIHGRNWAQRFAAPSFVQQGFDNFLNSSPLVIIAQTSVFFLTLFLLPTSFSGIATVYFSLGSISYARCKQKSNSNELANDLFLAKSLCCGRQPYSTLRFFFLFFKVFFSNCPVRLFLLMFVFIQKFPPPIKQCLWPIFLLCQRIK